MWNDADSLNTLPYEGFIVEYDNNCGLGALQFDGVDDEVDIPHNASLSFGAGDQMTVELWFNLSEPRSVYHLIGKRVACGDFNYQLAVGSGELHVSTGSSPEFRVGTPFATVGQWVHVAATCDGSTIRLYVNGQLEVTGPGSLGNANTEPLRIGQAGTCQADQRFVGEVDEVRVWNVARTASEIATNFDRTVEPISAGLVGYWRFDESDPGQTVLDLSAQTNHGTLGASASIGGDDPLRVFSTAPLVGCSTANPQGPCFDPAVNYAAGATSQSVFAADLDEDGDRDLMVANAGSGNVSVLLNDGFGIFTSPVDYPCGSSSSCVFAADLDGDNDFDLTVGNGASNDVSVLKNNGNGTFSAAVNYFAGFTPNSVFAADLDGDLDADLAITNYSADDNGADPVAVLKNNGDGTFAPAVNYPTQIDPASVFVADLDGDGDNDLAVAHDYSNISVLKNNGDGSFAAGVTYPAGDHPRGIAASDLDADGDRDLAVTNYLSDNVSVLRNNGDGTFIAPVNYNVGDGPFVAISIADLDGDSDSDIAVANELSDNASVLRNHGDGTFASAVNYTVGDGPYSVFAADLDGNGRLDLATANGIGGVSVLLNCGTVNVCACDCHGDPICDGVINNVQDVVAVINVAFRAAAPLVDPNANCPRERTDVNCDNVTSVLDVVEIVNVAFRANNPTNQFCMPCLYR